MITIVDYGMGNLGSIKNMLKKIGADSVITSNPDLISQSTKMILPGVGAFDTAMKRINDSGLRELLDQKALKDKIPVLGICLGMQLLTNSSEEGVLPGLGWIDAQTCSFQSVIDSSLAIPHMGWNVAEFCKQTPMNLGFEGEVRFYFVHSYYVKVNNASDSMMKTSYGVTFDSAVSRENIYGAQFHPEKSHKFGMQFLKNFAAL